MASRNEQDMTVELTHRTPLPVREHWKEIVQELAAVGSVPSGPECEEANAGIFWENSEDRERNWSRRKLQERKGLVSSTSARSADRKTITPPLSLVRRSYTLRHL